MKSLLMTLMMLIISVTLACSSKMDQQNLDLAPGKNIDGRWSGIYPGIGELIFDLKAEGNNLYGSTVHQGDSNTEIMRGKIKGNKISFEVPFRMGVGGPKMSVVYKGKILSDNEMELTFRSKSRGAKAAGGLGGFVDGYGGGGGGGGAGGFDTGFGGGGGFGGVNGESTKFILKRITEK